MHPQVSLNNNVIQMMGNIKDYEEHTIKVLGRLKIHV